MAIGRGQIPKEIGVGGGKRSAKRSAKKAGGKVEKVMHEWGQGQLHSGSKTGPKVKSQKQAIAIALSEQRKANKK